MTVLPRALRPGDRVAVVAPSGPVRERSTVARGLEVLRGWGLDPVVAPHAFDSYGHLAGRDEDRAADLNAAFRDPAVRAVAAVRGGYGATRILDRLDWEALAADPKALVGFSDTTALHAAAWTRLRLATIHGPGVARLHRATHDEALRRLLMDPEPAGVVHGTGDTETVAGGVAEGVLLGGNLTLLCALIGTPDFPDLTGAVLLVEDVGEAAYRVDRMLTQLRQAGVLGQVAGIAVGQLHGCEPLDVVGELLGGLGVPVLSGMPVGHVDDQLPLPLGVRVRLDADAGVLDVLEPATRP